MIINWLIGKQNWAFKNLTSHLMKVMPNHKHIVNGKTNEEDVKFLVSMEQLKEHEIDNKTILHMDGNRWYESTNY